MNNLGELIRLYGLDNLPDKVRKERELKRWREMMAQQRHEQDYLPNFLKCEAEARESGISQETKEDFNNRLSLRWIKYNQLEKNRDKQLKLLRQYSMISKMHRGR